MRIVVSETKIQPVPNQLGLLPKLVLFLRVWRAAPEVQLAVRRRGLPSATSRLASPTPGTWHVASCTPLSRAVSRGDGRMQGVGKSAR